MQYIGLLLCQNPPYPPPVGGQGRGHRIAVEANRLVFGQAVDVAAGPALKLCLANHIKSLVALVAQPVAKCFYVLGDTVSFVEAVVVEETDA